MRVVPGDKGMLMFTRILSYVLLFFSLSVGAIQAMADEVIQNYTIELQPHVASWVAVCAPENVSQATKRRLEAGKNFILTVPTDPRLHLMVWPHAEAPQAHDPVSLYSLSSHPSVIAIDREVITPGLPRSAVVYEPLHYGPLHEQSARRRGRSLAQIFSRNQQALFEAVQDNNEDTVQQLLETGAHPSGLWKGFQGISFRPDRSYSLVDAALISKNVRILTLLLRYANTQEREELLSRVNEVTGMTPLIYALSQMTHNPLYRDCCIVLLSYPHGLEQRDRGGYTALEWASGKLEDPDLTEQLLTAGANPNSLARTGRTPLSFVFLEGKRRAHEIIPLLLAHGANPIARSFDGKTTIKRLAQEINTAVGDAKERLEKARKAIQDFYNPAFLQAARDLNFAALREANIKGADPMTVDAYGNTALDLVAQYAKGSQENIRRGKVLSAYLLAQGTLPSAASIDQKTLERERLAYTKKNGSKNVYQLHEKPHTAMADNDEILDRYIALSSAKK